MFKLLTYFSDDICHFIGLNVRALRLEPSALKKVQAQNAGLVLLCIGGGFLT